MVYSNAHRLFLQVFTSRKIMSETDTMTIYIKTAEQVQADAPPDGLQSFLQTINKNLKPLYMEIRRGRAEESGQTFYALVNCYEDEHSKLASDFTAQEIEFVKKVMKVIVSTDEGAVSSIDLINIGHDLPKRISPQATEELLSKLTADQWLTETRGNISFGPRAVIELGQYLKNTFENQISECKLCHDFVISGHMCSYCGVKIHKYCAATNFQDMVASKRKCPACKELWEKEIIKLPKNSNTNIQAQPQAVRDVEVLPATSSSRSSSRRSNRR